jgi:hypothetical protein
MANKEKLKQQALEREKQQVDAKVADFMRRNPDHKMPVTRRDFLAIGAIQASAFVVLPSILSQVMLARTARAAAANCPVYQAHPFIPLLIIEGAGGFSLPGNWVPLDGAFNPLAGAGYSVMGLGANSGNLTLDTKYGLPMARASAGLAPTNANFRGLTGNGGVLSKVLDGMEQKLTPDGSGKDPKANISQGGLWFSSTSDSSSNMISPTMLLTRMGMTGQLIKVAGSNGTDSGSNSQVAYDVDSTAKALRIGRFQDLQGALSYGPAFASLPKKYLDALAKAITGMTGAQKDKFRGMQYGEDAQLLGHEVLGLGTLGQCGYERNESFTGPVPGIDPQQDANARLALTGSATGTINNGDVAFATIIFNLLQKNIGVAGFTIGGCDYHSGNQTDGDQKDFEIGVRIGTYFKLASLMGVPAACMVYTDGGISSRGGTRTWAGDNNNTSGAVLITYNPSGAFQFAKPQIQAYRSGGAENKGILGASPQLAGLAVAANILELSGRANLLDSLVQVSGAVSVRTSDYDKLLFRRAG